MSIEEETPPAPPSSTNPIYFRLSLSPQATSEDDLVARGLCPPIACTISVERHEDNGISVFIVASPPVGGASSTSDTMNSMIDWLSKEILLITTPVTIFWSSVDDVVAGYLKWDEGNLLAAGEFTTEWEVEEFTEENFPREFIPWLALN